MQRFAGPPNPWRLWWTRPGLPASASAAIWMGAVLLDGSGALLRPAIIWADQRAVSEQALLSQRVGDRRLYEITGNRNNPTNSICKIMWSMAHDGWTAGWQRR